MRGGEGIAGPRGLPGYKGQKGIQGEPGMKGVLGPTGAAGQAGLKGPSIELDDNPLTDKERRSITLLDCERTSKDCTGLDLGTKENPATCCLDLMICSPGLPDGFYYVDPNGGSLGDAFSVFCNFTLGGSTCVSPITSQFEYLGLGPVQLRFLRLYSHSVSQRFTYSCPSSRESSGPHSHSTDTHVHFLGDNGEKIEYGHRSYRVKLAGCQSAVRSVDVTDVEIWSWDVDLLPLRDVTFSAWSPGGETSFTLGPVCFL
ncbi:collagen alpha-1(V) chain [Heptranchias perlo]|uniref:collagen alpha-1(V) chain n=1 Tax=Heptranchias perlo TaxID=212740 RepID=UPI00355A285D